MLDLGRLYHLAKAHLQTGPTVFSCLFFIFFLPFCLSYSQPRAGCPSPSPRCIHLCVLCPSTRRAPREVSACGRAAHRNGTIVYFVRAAPSSLSSSLHFYF